MLSYLKETLQKNPLREKSRYYPSIQTSWKPYKLTKKTPLGKKADITLPYKPVGNIANFTNLTKKTPLGEKSRCYSSIQTSWKHCNRPGGGILTRH